MCALTSARFENIIVEQHDQTALIRLNRPAALNALSDSLITELAAALDAAEENDGIRVIVITGSDKAFAAGADIKEMADKNFADMIKADLGAGKWSRLARTKKPTIAAVAGYALGGGFELALMCDFIIAADTARFGLPELSLGTLPGIGGTQRLPRLIGRGRAMEIILTSRTIDSKEAFDMGLVVRVVPLDQLHASVLETAQKIAAHSTLVVRLAKEAINCADESALSEGLLFEQRLFHATFATEDQKEGMKAFVEKRKADFKDR